MVEPEVFVVLEGCKAGPELPESGIANPAALSEAFELDFLPSDWAQALLEHPKKATRVMANNFVCILFMEIRPQR